MGYFYKGEKIRFGGGAGFKENSATEIQIVTENG
jgi:hypothetical protein